MWYAYIHTSSSISTSSTALTATRCNTLQHNIRTSSTAPTATHCNTSYVQLQLFFTLDRTNSDQTKVCNTLLQTATQHTYKLKNTYRFDCCSLLTVHRAMRQHRSGVDVRMFNILHNTMHRSTLRCHTHTHTHAQEHILKHIYTHMYRYAQTHSHSHAHRSKNFN